MDSGLIKQGIADYIEERWTYRYNIDNISVDYKGNGDYIAICTYYKEGYGGDIRGRIIITFYDVKDITDEIVDDDDLWFSAYVNVASVKIDTINTVHTEDLYSFSKFANDMHDCLQTIYSDLPANENDRLDFYVRNH